MSRQWLRYTITAKQVNATIDVFLDRLPVKYCDWLHNFFYIRRVHYKTLIPRKPMSYYSLNIKMTSHRFYVQNVIEHRFSWNKCKLIS